MPGEELHCAQRQQIHFSTAKLEIIGPTESTTLIFDTDASRCKHLKVATLQIFTLLSVNSINYSTENCNYAVAKPE